jgi:hypothetical protein
MARCKNIEGSSSALLEMMEATGVIVLLISQRWLEENA